MQERAGYDDDDSDNELEPVCHPDDNAADFDEDKYLYVDLSSDNSDSDEY